jgi:hypothetical protein
MPNFIDSAHKNVILEIEEQESITPYEKQSEKGFDTGNKER